jgi:hypothetical protein
MPTPPLEHRSKIHNPSIPKTEKKASPATSPAVSTPFASARSSIIVTSSYASWAGAVTRPFGSSKTFSPRSFLHPHPHPTNHLKAIHSAEKKYAMKVLSAECYGTGSDNFELAVLQKLQRRGGDRNHPGYEHISILHESFIHKGPNGDHVCLIFEPM